MSQAVIVALISAMGLIMSGVLVELTRTRRRTDQIIGQVQPNGGSSMRDDVKAIKHDVRELRENQNNHANRLTRVETIQSILTTERH